MQIKKIDVLELVLNTGQMAPALPANPRFIKNSRYEALVQSIRDDPEMMELREAIVYPMQEGGYLVVAGNMRTRACKELGYKRIPCKVLSNEISGEKLRAIATKDNVNFGSWDWDAIANEWNEGELSTWGLEAFTWNEEDFDQPYNEPEKKEASGKKISLTYEREIYEQVLQALKMHGEDPSEAVLSLLKLKDSKGVPF